VHNFFLFSLDIFYLKKYQKTYMFNFFVGKKILDPQRRACQMASGGEVVIPMVIMLYFNWNKY
jgi:hypothetical protein